MESTDFFSMSAAAQFRDAWNGARVYRVACLSVGNMTGAALARLSMKRWAIRYLYARWGVVFSVPGADDNVGNTNPMQLDMWGNRIPMYVAKRAARSKKKEPITGAVNIFWQSEVKRLREDRKQNGGVK